MCDGGDGEMLDWKALVEWESGGLADVPTKNILSLVTEALHELKKRSVDLRDLKSMLME